MKPSLIHPRKITLYRRKETFVDPDFGPTGEIEWDEPIILQGQVKYDKYQQLEPTGMGNDPVSSGHIVFYDKDWVPTGGKIGDEMEAEEDFVSPSRLVITEIRPAAHYHGKNWHVHVFFQRKRARSR